MTSTVSSLVQSLFQDSSLCRKYISILSDESIETIDDLQSLEISDVTSLGFKEFHAKRLLKNGVRFLLKIAVDRSDAVIGYVRVCRASKLKDIRKEIIADELHVPESFVFQQDGAVVTSVQEEKWDAGIFFDAGSEKGVCVVTAGLKVVDSAADEYNVSKKKMFPDGEVSGTDSPFKIELSSPEWSLPEDISGFPPGPFNDPDQFSPFLSASPSSSPPSESIDPEWGNLHSTVPYKSVKAMPDLYQSSLNEDFPPLIQGKGVTLTRKMKNTEKPITDNPIDLSMKTDVYIGNLAPQDGIRISDDRLRSHVYQFGLVKRFQRLPDPNWAYIIFGYPFSAKVCTEEMNGFLMGDRPLICQYATDRSRAEPDRELKGCLLLRGVPKFATSKDLMNCFLHSPYMENVIHRRSKAEAYAMFKYESDAAKVASQYEEVDIKDHPVEVQLYKITKDVFGKAKSGVKQELAFSNTLVSDTKTGVKHLFSKAISESLQYNVPAYSETLTPLVTTDGRLDALCLVLVEQSIENPLDMAKICDGLVNAEFPDASHYRWGDFKRVLLAQYQHVLLLQLDSVKDFPDSKKGAHALRHLMEFLAHLYYLQVISSSILLSYAAKLTAIPASACREAVKALLDVCGQVLRENSGLQTKVDALEKFAEEETVEVISVEESKLGDQLYDYVKKMYPNQAGKITGMLLGLGSKQVEGLLRNARLLQHRMKEAHVLLTKQK
eukprot:m.307950 g.307950  ORF g.307950 m.307950 type:complete len:721 (+) comp43085_c0_seq1:158-2320(+)